MKKIITYIAWDDTEFDNEEDCKEYEQNAKDMITELCLCYTFYDKVGKEIEVFVSRDIESMMSAFEAGAGTCYYVKVHKIPSKKVDDFQDHEFGYNLPNKVGIFEYDWDRVEWKKVAE